MIYLDNAATTQIDPSVLDAMVRFELAGRGNPYRGLHEFAERATVAVDNGRATIAKFIGAAAKEIIFTKSATEGLNLAIWNMVRGLGEGDEVVNTIFDHHATLLPLIELSKKQGFRIRTITPVATTTPSDSPLTGGEYAFMHEARRLIGERTRLVIAPHVSNVTGEVLPIKALADLAHAVDAQILVDGAQAVAHMPVDVGNLGCDAYAFSAHKMYGPMGIGAVYVSRGVMESWKPMIFGGGMVEEVVFGVGGKVAPCPYARYLPAPRLFEAGTPNVTGIIGFAGACEIIDKIGRANIVRHERALFTYLIEQISQISSIRLLGTSDIQHLAFSILSFTVEGHHPHDVAQHLADHGIAVRAGHHCAAPYSQSLSESGTVRVSFGKDSTKTEIDQLIAVLRLLR